MEENESLYHYLVRFLSQSLFKLMEKDNEERSQYEQGVIDALSQCQLIMISYMAKYENNFKNKLNKKNKK